MGGFRRACCSASFSPGLAGALLAILCAVAAVPVFVGGAVAWVLGVVGRLGMGWSLGEEGRRSKGWLAEQSAGGC